MLDFYKVKAIVGNYSVVVDDCQTIEIHANHIGTDYFSFTNPFDHLYDGWKWQSQPAHPDWSPTNGGQSKIPQGTWNTEGVTIRR
jgi:hypothetical protein